MKKRIQFFVLTKMGSHLNNFLHVHVKGDPSKLRSKPCACETRHLVGNDAESDN